MYITPNLPECMGTSDSVSIQNAVDLASARGWNRVVIPRLNQRTGECLWIIDSAVLLPDGMHIVLEDCTLRQADGCFDNVFRNKNLYTEGPSYRAEQKDIRISGVGNAVIDGGVHNGLTEFTSETEGYPHISQNNMILFHNVDGFVIENLTLRNPRWWAIHLMYASNGRISNITVDAKDDVINQDGIDLRVGCHNISITDVFGHSGDDLIALSGFLGYEKRKGFLVEGKCLDIHAVSIRNVVGTAVSKAVVALRNHDGIRLYDVTIDGVIDTSGDGRGHHPYAIVRIGQKDYYNVRPSEAGETSRIFVQNVHAAHGDAVMVNVTLTDSVIENIFCGPQARSAFSTRSDWPHLLPGAYMRNVSIRGIYCDENNDSAAEMIEIIDGEPGVDGQENVFFSDVYLPKKGE